uniref:C-type lectin domain-containing protein n=1 Tax=Anopheles farauti TaxID=69004 RepID=A0A182QL56_9DIPT
MASKTLFLVLCLALFAIEVHGAKTFKAYRRKTAFFTAWQICRLYGGHLASILSAEENAMVESAIEAVGTFDGYWFIGGTDIGVEGRFIWIGLNMAINGAAYKNWNTGEPNNLNGNEDCIAMATGAKWIDIPCDSKLEGYVCAFGN